MLKVKCICLLGLFISLVFSCSSDNDSSSSSSADYSYQGSDINFSNGFSIDAGEPSFGYYYNDFLLSTSAVELNESTLPTISIQNFGSTEAILYVSLQNEGDNFESGTYIYSNSNDVSQYFNNGYLRFPGEDNIFNLLDDEYLIINGGSVIVNGSINDYSLEFNVELSNGDNLDFSYSGTFTYLEAL